MFNINNIYSVTGICVIVKEIEFASPAYEQSLVLREQELRLPLGLTLSPSDTGEDASQWHFALYEDEKMLACVVIKPMHLAHVKLRQMAVDNAFQGQGLGALLIKEIKLILADRHIRSIELHARESALGFYQKLNFKSQGSAFIEQGIAHIAMTGTL